MQNIAQLEMPSLPSFCSKLPKVLESAAFKPGMTDKPGTHSAFFTAGAGTTGTTLRSAREATLPKQQTQGVLGEPEATQTTERVTDLGQHKLIGYERL